jgi:hypothetical protein
VEPPGEDVPDPGQARAPEAVGALRLSAALAAVALALGSTGHLLVLGLLVAVVAGTRARGVAVLLAVTAALVRWGGPSLSAVGGDQAVLGAAVTIGSTAAAASCALAALAVVLTAPRDVPLVVAVGVVAGFLAAGPAFPQDVPVRLVGIVIGCALAYGARWVPLRSWAAVAAGAGALLLAAVA